MFFMVISPRPFFKEFVWNRLCHISREIFNYIVIVYHKAAPDQLRQSVGEGSDPLPPRERYVNACVKVSWLDSPSESSTVNVSANATHIVAFVRNTASKAVEFTLAYVNNMVATLQEGKATISPLSVGVATVIGSFIEGKTYTVKLTNVFNTAITFTATV